MQYQIKNSNCHLTSLTVSLFVALVIAIFVVPISRAQSVSSSLSTKIEKAAQDSVGKKMWFGFGLPNGHLGCAASVSNVLKKAGIKNVSSAATKYMRAKIRKSAYKTQEFRIKEGGNKAIDDKRLAQVAKPGDVLIAFMDPLPKGNIGPKAHCGIISRNGKVFTNDWNDGIWKHASIHTYFDSYEYLRVIRFK